MAFWKRKEEEKENVLDKLDELAYLLGPEGYERYKEEGKKEEWKQRIFFPAMKASYKALWENDPRWFGNYTIEDIKDKIIKSAVKTWTEKIKKKLLLIREDDENSIYFHPLLVYSLPYDPKLTQYVELRRADGLGTFPVLQLKVDEKPEAKEFYVAVSKDVAVIGLALLEDEIKNGSARCDYRFELVKMQKRAVLPEEEMELKI